MRIGRMPLPVGNPRLRVGVGLAVADVGLLGVELDGVAGGDLEAHALAGFQHLAGRDAFGLHAVSLELGFELSSVALSSTLKAKKSMPARSAWRSTTLLWSRSARP
jgi:hypothetical protein